MIRVLGIDPGSRITGFGVIDSEPQRLRHVASGVIAVTAGSTASRLGNIFQRLDAIIEQFAPEQAAIEQVFMYNNAQSALKLGQARGAAIVAAAGRSVPVYEYTATQVKQATTGRGHAGKGQVQHMVQMLLGLGEPPPPDAADALAVAICHCHYRETGLRIAAASGPSPAPRSVGRRRVRRRGGRL